MSNQHVVNRSEGWAVKGEGNSRATHILSTQKEAFEVARIIANNQGGDVIIHGLNGQIRDRNTYGKKDPFPPHG